MSILNKEQIEQMIKENNIQTVDDIQNVLKDMFADTIQAMLEAEMSDQLGHDKNAKTDGSNRRNGHSKKSIRSEYGDSDIKVPRDRNGDFEPKIVAKHQKSVAGIEDQIIILYSKGMSTRDIQDHLNRLYGIDVSPTLISNVTNKLMPLVREWQNRPLMSTYAIVFLDAIHYKVKQEGSIVNKAAYVCIGVDLDGHKDVLGIWIGESESAKFWLNVLNELRNRGVNDVLIFAVDNLTGFSEAIGACYPEAEIQKCIIHQIRNSVKFVSYKDVKKITAALKPIYTAASEEAALSELEEFEATWGTKYPLVTKSWRKNWGELATFFKYPPEIRKIIYTTNMIESYHRQLRKVTKGKSVFPNDDSLLKMLYLATEDITRRWTGRVQNWGRILLQLSIYFPDKVESHLK